MGYQFTESDVIAGGTFFQFKNIGDSIQGTYIKKRQGRNALKNNEIQNLYDILQEDGSVAIIGGKPRTDYQMKEIKIGQIIELRYTELGKITKPGINPEHIVRVYAKASLVNKDWIEEQKQLIELTKQFGAGTTVEEEGNVDVSDIDFGQSEADNTAPFESQPKVDVKPISKLDEITNLAVKKLGIKDITNMSLLKDTVMSATNLAFIEINYDNIIKALSTMPDKQ